MQNFNQELKLGYIPNSVQFLLLNSFNKTLNDPNIIPSICHLTINNFNQIDIGIFKNRLIFISIFSDRPLILPNSECISNTYSFSFDYYIINCVCKQFFHNNFFGNGILEELTKKVFHPNRLEKICDIYKIDLDDLLTIY
jgi:hypothetical protein